MSAYCETCAAIGHVYVNYRLFLLHGESRYYDVLERTLYNGLLSGVSLDGGAFFYPNPLESIGQHQRQPWFGCACCPSNICRFIPSLPGYVYAVQGDRLYVNLYMSNTADLQVAGRQVRWQQETAYPYDGDVTLSLQRGSGRFALCLRIPGWVRNQPVPSDLYRYTDLLRPQYRLSVNGQLVTLGPADMQRGYAVIERRWQKGDRVQLHLDMPARTVEADVRVTADCGRVAVERGPLVYCAEFADNEGVDVRGILLNQKPSFQLGQTSIMGRYTVQTLTTRAQTLRFADNGDLQTSAVDLRLIPYYAWAHRGSGAMTVWLPQQLRATQPQMPATLASRARIEASHTVPSIRAINDRLVPAHADDRSVPYYHWWPKQGSTEWIEYHLPEAHLVQACTVYWFDDAPWGGCRVPVSWRILYRTPDGTWTQVTGANHYPCRKGVANTVQFDPVQTDALRLEVVQPADASCGLFEWEVAATDSVSAQ